MIQIVENPPLLLFFPAGPAGESACSPAVFVKFRSSRYNVIHIKLRGKGPQQNVRGGRGKDYHLSGGLFQADEGLNITPHVRGDPQPKAPIGKLKGVLAGQIPEGRNLLLQLGSGNPAPPVAEPAEEALQNRFAGNLPLLPALSEEVTHRRMAEKSAVYCKKTDPCLHHSYFYCNQFAASGQSGYNETMSSYDPQIRKVKKAQAENEDRRRDYQTALGALLLEEPEEVFRETEILEAYQDAAALRDELPELRDQRDSLIERADKMDELEEARGEVQEKIQRIRKEQQPYYEGLGKAAYDLYRRGILVGEGLTEEMQELADQDDEIKQLENALGKSRKSQGEKNILNKIVTKGRAAVMSTSRSTKVSALQRMFKRIGGRVAEGDGLDKIAETGFTDAADPVLQIRERIDKLKIQEKDYSQRLSRLQEELEDRGAGGKTRRVIRDYESRIAEKEQEKKRAARVLGSRFSEDPPENLKEKEGIQQELANLAQTDSREKELKKLMERLEAGVEAERLEKVIQDKEKRIERLNREIEERQKKTAELQKELHQAEESKESKEKERGSLDVENLL